MPEELDYKTKYHINEAVKEERQESDKRYAIKVVERIVFAMIGIFALAALYWIFLKAGIPQP